MHGLTITRAMGHGGEVETVETYRGTTVKMELKEKVRSEAATQPRDPVSVEADLLAALVNLGYRPAEAERAIAAAIREEAERPFATLLRDSLKRLSRV